MNFKIFIIGIIFTFLVVIVQIFIIAFANIEVKKRRIFLILDFLGIFILFFFPFVLLITYFYSILIFPLVIAFIFIYDLVLFKIVKKFILQARLSRIKEEINDALIESLKALAELDYKSAYHILEEALKKHPSSKELLNLKALFDKNMKKVNPEPDSGEPKLIK